MSYEVSYNKTWMRWEGEPVSGECDFNGCHETIRRGPSFECEEPNCDCGLYFCYEHQGYIHNEYTAEAKEDSVEFLRTILETKPWEDVRSQFPNLMKEYEYIVYDY